MKLKENNKGISLVMVIAAIALVTILVTVALTIGLYNYQMKVTNSQSKNNFYDAEKVLDEIRLGLQSDVSDAMSEAYVSTMAKYSDTSDQNATRTDEFNNEYVRILREKLKLESNENYYNTKYLLGFLDSKVKSNTTLSALDGKNPILITNKYGIVLQNLHLKYVNERSYVSEVTTNIQIQYPQMNFTQTGSYPNVLKYCVIAQDGVLVPNNTAKIDVCGSMYAGGSPNSLEVQNGITMNIETGNDLIVADTLKVGSGASFYGQKKVSLWAKDIEAENASAMTLAGTTYMANDLTLMGGANVTLSGEYYGFGNPNTAVLAANATASIKNKIEVTPADYSSAIIVNAIGGSKAKLNLKGVTNLVLAGNAYIGNSKTFMGESLTVKSNQIAYLVPESCIGSSNPMTETSHTALLDATGASTDRDKEALFKNQLLTVVKSKVSSNVKSIELMTNGNLYYYYMKFENAKAASDYFASYYQSGSGMKLKDYLKVYIDDQALTINKSAVSKKALNGNILVYDETGITSIADTIKQGSDLSDDEEYKEKEINWQEMFGAYNHNLTVNYDELSASQKNRTVFENLVKSKKLFGIKKSGWFVYTDEEQAESYAAYFTKNTENTLNVNAAFLNSAPKGAKVRMIIAAGDVNVSADFSGTILADGRVTIQPSTSSIQLSASQTELAKLITGGIYDTTDSSIPKYVLEDYLIDAERYTGRVSEKKDNQIKLEDLVVYTNWSKE